jgi:N-acetylneuraminate synthase
VTKRKPTLLIAEAGVNHNGSLAMALELVDAAADAGADIVKFQTFKTEALVSKETPRAPYQTANTGVEGSQHEMLRALELSRDDHKAIFERCRTKGIGFLSTPFDPASLWFLVKDLGLPLLKLGSSEVTNGPLLVDAGRSGSNIILSTGMATLADVELALSALAFGMLGHTEFPTVKTLAASLSSARKSGLLRNRITLLQCTTAYPTPPKDINLSAMQTMAETFEIPVGFSDHSEGYAITLAAVALGAVIIEKHLTIDRSLPGPDHLASIEPDTFEQMVRDIRTVEQSLGDGNKIAVVSEIQNMPVARKSLVATGRIASGAEFSEGNVAVMRPGTGRTPFDYWQIMGRAAKKGYEAGELIGKDE